MPNIEMYYFDLAKTAIYALGGPAVIVLALATFFGRIFSKGKIAQIEAVHLHELEEKKAELDKTKSQFFRYSEKQFDLYNDLWRVLMRTRILADELWENAQPNKLPAFAEQISLTRIAVMDNMLLIEEEHYSSLDKLLKKFELFQFGKQKLSEIGLQNSDNESIIQATETEVKRTIAKNQTIKAEYTKLIMKIGQSFRNQIKG